MMASEPSQRVKKPFWDGYVWHDSVHENLGEILIYYLARVRPFDQERIASRLGAMLNEKRLGSVRVFPIYGPYDILIRAWLHPAIEQRFRTWLDEALERMRTLTPFAVTQIDKRWYWKDGPEEGVNRDLLQSLVPETIRQVQTGQNPKLLEKLQQGGLVMKRQRGEFPTVKFFVAVNIEDATRSLQEATSRRIRHFLDSNSGITGTSLYRGYGFCSILLKGQVASFFNIADTSVWIGREFGPLNASTDTYLVHLPDHIVGNEEIGDATFAEIEGRNLFVQSIIPELYETDSDYKSRVERFLEEGTRPLDLTRADKNIIRNYLKAFLAKNETDMLSTLFVFYSGLENYLRATHLEFAGRKELSISDLYKEAGVPKDAGKFISIGPLLKFYSAVFQRIEPARALLVRSDWESFAELRNEIAHGDLDILEKWDSSLRTVMEHLPRVRAMIAEVESVTSEVYTGL